MNIPEIQKEQSLYGLTQQHVVGVARKVSTAMLFIISLILGYIGLGTFLMGTNPSDFIKAVMFAAIMLLPFLEIAFLNIKKSRKAYWDLIGSHMAIFIASLTLHLIDGGVDETMQVLFFSGFAIFGIFSWAFNIFF